MGLRTARRALASTRPCTAPRARTDRCSRQSPPWRAGAGRGAAQPAAAWPTCRPEPEPPARRWGVAASCAADPPAAASAHEKVFVSGRGCSWVGGGWARAFWWSLAWIARLALCLTSEKMNASTSGCGRGPGASVRALLGDGESGGCAPAWVAGAGRCRCARPLPRLAARRPRRPRPLRPPQRQQPRQPGQRPPRQRGPVGRAKRRQRRLRTFLREHLSPSASASSGSAPWPPARTWRPRTHSLCEQQHRQSASAAAVALRAAPSQLAVSQSAACA